MLNVLRYLGAEIAKCYLNLPGYSGSIHDFLNFLITYVPLIWYLIRM